MFKRNLITQIDSENKEVILVGDFNCNCSPLANNKANDQTKILAEATNALQLEQLIKEPTCTSYCNNKINGRFSIYK